MQDINVALIGHRFMGKAHTHAYRDVNLFFPSVPYRPRLKVIAGRDAAAVAEAANLLGWEESSTDWQEAVTRDDIDLVDVATPNHLHADVAITAAEAGKQVICEKPLAVTVPQARAMVAAVENAGVSNTICFHFRRYPAVRLARKLIEDGQLGDIYHFRGWFLAERFADPATPLGWRMQQELAGFGVFGDLGSHVLDIARYLLGDVSSVCGNFATYIKERPTPEGGSGAVTVDDCAQVLMQFANGAQGMLEVTKLARGNKNNFGFEVNGSKGSIRFYFERLNELQYYCGDDPGPLTGFRTIHASDSVQHDYMHGYWPAAAHSIGYGEAFIHIVKDFLEALGSGEPMSPDFVDGLRVQEIMEAVGTSVQDRGWVDVPSPA